MLTFQEIKDFSMKGLVFNWPAKRWFEFEFEDKVQRAYPTPREEDCFTLVHINDQNGIEVLEAYKVTPDGVWSLDLDTGEELEQLEEDATIFNQVKFRWDAL